jgi:hypothetical protein
MADFRAVAAVSQAIVELLQENYNPADFNNHQLEFKVYVAREFTQPMNAGVSLFLYRIFANGLRQAPPAPPGSGIQPNCTQLPVDLHFLLTAWAQDASLQHTIAGWMMRVIEDTPTLPTGLLNQKYPNLFQPDETIAIVAAELSTEELFRIWEVIVNHAYQISVPYVARRVKIGSSRWQSAGRPVQERVFDLTRPGDDQP